MRKFLFSKLAVIAFCTLLFVVQVKADTSSSYVFEEGGIDVSGGESISNTYLLDHQTVNYDVQDNLASSTNYQEITGYSALQIFCGNNIVEPGEDCDDGNFVNGDGCSATCKSELPVCGNAVIETWEECDDGNLANGDGCSSVCINESSGSSSSSSGGGGGGTLFWAVCGNGVIEQNEECDDGNKKNWDGCSQTCHFEETLHFVADDIVEPVCGNGVLELGEQCDDENLTNFDWCNYACEAEEFQYDTEVPAEGEETENPDSEKKVDEIIVKDIFQIAECGNGILEEGERCDDGNTEDNDGCSYRCRIEPKIGGQIEPPENENQTHWTAPELEEEIAKHWEILNQLHGSAFGIQGTPKLGLLEIFFLVLFWIFFVVDIDFRRRKKERKFKFFKTK